MSDAERLLSAINTLLNVFIVDETRFPSAEGQMRYNPIDFQSLRYIDQNPGCRAIDIAKSLGVAPTTLQSSLDRLLKRGALVKTNHASDGRAKAYRLSESGQLLRDAIHRQDLSNMEAVLSIIDEDARVLVLEQIEKVSHVIKLM